MDKYWKLIPRQYFSYSINYSSNLWLTILDKKFKVDDDILNTQSIYSSIFNSIYPYAFCTSVNVLNILKMKKMFYYDSRGYYVLNPSCGFL